MYLYSESVNPAPSAFAEGKRGGSYFIGLIIKKSPIGCD